MSDELIELPMGWVWTTLGDVVEVFDNRRVPLNSNERGKRKGYYPYYGANGQVDSINDYLFDGDYILVAEDGGYFDNPTKKVAYRVTGKFWVNNHAHIITPIGNILTEFLVYYLNTINWMQYVSGTTRLKLTQGSLIKLPILLPPLNEQKRIVTKIEELTDRTQKAKEALDSIPQLCDRFRQSVLAAAFRGDLTKEWREQNPDVEPASVLLERIRKERRQKWEEVELKRMLESGKPPKDDKWKLRYKEAEYIENFNLPKLPHGWHWASVEQFADVGTGATPLRSEPKFYENGIIPWITSGALNNLFIDKTEEFITPIAVQETNAKIFPKHSLLVAMYGEGKTRGKVSELLIEAATNQACAALILLGIASKVQPFVKLFFQKNYNDIRRLASGGVQPNLNLSMIKSTLIPISPLKEQKEIVSKIQTLFKIIDNIEKQHQQAAEKLETLNQSILAKAFRGELVPQDPNDEPASLLLERIKSEQEKLTPNKPKSKKTTKPNNKPNTIES